MRFTCAHCAHIYHAEARGCPRCGRLPVSNTTAEGVLADAPPPDRYERTADWLRESREMTDRFRLRAGIVVAQMAKRRAYGAGVINELAKDSGIARSTLYEYAQVACFVVAWQQQSARRIFSNHPMLTYTHLRIAVKLDYESAIDALLQAEVEGMTPDQFGVYVGRLRGKDVEPALFDMAGLGYEVFRTLQQTWRTFHGKQVRVIVKEVK